jgi:hypothetical protein
MRAQVPFVATHGHIPSIHFRLGEAIVGLHGIRSGRGARALSAPPLNPSVPVSYKQNSALYDYESTCLLDFNLY